MPLEIAFIALVLLICFYMLWNIGANDVANAIGTSVGSGSLSMKKAIFIAAVFEFCGAAFFGSHVSKTIQSGIIDTTDFIQDPNVIIIGMMSALLATSLCLQGANIKGWPISTTHSIVGSIIGFGIIAAGVGAVQWGVILTVLSSWFISPVISAILAFLFFKVVQKYILFSSHPILMTKRIFPFFLFVVIFTFSTTFFSGRMGGTTPYLYGLGCAILGLIAGYIFMRFYKPKALLDAEEDSLHQQKLLSLQEALKNLKVAKLFASELESEEYQRLLDHTKQLTRDVRKKSNIRPHLTHGYDVVEKLISYLQIFSACGVAFGHGANDVANAIGPVAAIFSIYANPSNDLSQTQVPLWLLVFGGFGIVIGLATYGWKVIETIGKKITELTPSRGFCAEFGAAATILVASKIGLPISTTHCLVGAVLGVGFARGLAALNLNMIKGIAFSWLVTVPSSAIICMGIYLVFDFIARQFIL
jgi:PiT family inorganic phosphate transporter